MNITYESFYQKIFNIPFVAVCVAAVHVAAAYVVAARVAAACVAAHVVHAEPRVAVWGSRVGAAAAAVVRGVSLSAARGRVPGSPTATQTLYISNAFYRRDKTMNN